MATITKDDLDKAANSSDPAVRGLAIRYKEIDVEKAMLEGFFGVYASAPITEVRLAEPHLATSNGRPVVPPRKPPVPQAIPAVEAPVRPDNPEFRESVRAVLLEAGRPLSLSALHRAYFERFPNAASLTVGSFRQKLIRGRAYIGKCADGSGYWPTGEAIPEHVAA